MEQPFKILYIHNHYLYAGGEDLVFENEKQLLKKCGQFSIDELAFSNETFNKGNVFQRLFISISIFFNLVSFYKVYRKVKRDKIKIVHVHNFFYRATPSIFWAARLAGAKTILTVHNYRLLCIGGNLLRNGSICEKCVRSKTLYKGVMHRCFQQSILKSFLLAGSNLFNRLVGTMQKKVDYYLALTPFMSRMLQSSTLGIPEDKIIVKANFIDDFNFSDYESRDNFYLYIGRLSEEKGIIKLLQSWKSLHVPLFIVGDGPLAKEVSELVSEINHITLLGRKNKQEVISLMRSCRALVFPSLCYEGMPMNILEAKSCGTVVIANRTRNIEGLVTHLTNGILYDGDIFDGIETFSSLSEPEVKYLMHQSRIDFEQRFTEQVALEKLTEIYKKVLAC